MICLCITGYVGILLTLRESSQAVTLRKILTISSSPNYEVVFSATEQVGTKWWRRRAFVGTKWWQRRAFVLSNTERGTAELFPVGGHRQGRREGEPDPDTQEASGTTASSPETTDTRSQDKGDTLLGSKQY